ncbi:MAG: acetate/propionate family kinase [Acetobacteraceae bacterium]|nr:acetate/propionate family kinase [Acetobacteraceae bacterium]
MSDHLLVLNAGSSSLKFAAYTVAGAAPVARFAGQVEGIGAAARFTVRDAAGASLAARDEGRLDHGGAVGLVTGWLERAIGGGRVAAVGHRVVHGGADFAAPVQVDATVMAALRALVPLAPLHQPHNLAGIDAAAARFPGVPQVACFDTSFHRSQAWEAQTFALPPRFYDQGIRRYGFHGLSYEFIARTLAAENPALAAGRVVAAHLGNGASLCAMHGGRSVATTMGFTALDGVPMGTRSGALDPGLVLHMITAMDMRPEEVAHLLYHESGLKGMSGISQDVRAIEAAGTEAARRALSHFAWRVRQAIGALAASLGGIDALVFTAGIGEHAAGMRARICEGLDFLGIAVDPARNAAHARDIATDAATTRVLVVRTDEEGMMARHMLDVLGR